MSLTRSHLIVVLVGLASLASSAAAEAQDLGGTYTVAFASVADNCEEDALALDRSQITLESRDDDRIVARIPGVPAMTGTERRGGQFRADVSTDDSPIDNTRARYSVAGRGGRGEIQLVFIAEYYRDDRPLCTQSWSGTGSAGESSAKAEPQKVRASRFGPRWASRIESSGR